MLRSFDQGWASHRSELRKGELLDKDHSTIHATNADDSESRDVKPRSEFEEHFKLDRSQCEKAKEIWIHLYDRRYKTCEQQLQELGNCPHASQKTLLALKIIILKPVKNQSRGLGALFKQALEQYERHVSCELGIIDN